MPCVAKTQGGQEGEGRMLKPQPFLGFPRKRQGRARWTVWEDLVPITSVGSGL